MRCQNGTSKTGCGGSRYLPYAFTEQGVAMLSGVLTSPRAIGVNIEIMRAFVRLRQLIASHKELGKKLEELEHQIRDHDEKYKQFSPPFASRWLRRNRQIRKLDFN